MTTNEPRTTVTRSMSNGSPSPPAPPPIATAPKKTKKKKGRHLADRMGPLTVDVCVEMKQQLQKRVGQQVLIARD